MPVRPRDTRRACRDDAGARSRDLYLRHGFEATAELRLPFGGPPL